MQTEKNLAEQKERFESIFNATTDSIIIYDENGFIAEANPFSCKMFGYEYDELINLHVSMLDRNFDDFKELKETAFSGREYSAIHKRFKKDGTVIEVSYSGTPFIFKGKPHVLSIGKDITAQKQAEEDLKKAEEELRHEEKKILVKMEHKVKERTNELEKTNYELLQFTSVASHDLKEPVRKILLFGKMLKDRVGESLDETSMSYLNKIIRSSQRMSELIDDLLLLSRLTQESPYIEIADLNMIWNQTLDDLELSIKEKQASIFADELPVIEGIPMQFGQVFRNLITNSLKFSKAGVKPEITITAEEFTEKDQKFFTITYRDNGIGFKAEYADKIFDVFQRLHSAAEYEGTGVGLAIVKKIITLHKGEIIAVSKENEGAEFSIVVPEKQQKEPISKKN